MFYHLIFSCANIYAGKIYRLYSRGKNFFRFHIDKMKTDMWSDRIWLVISSNGANCSAVISTGNKKKENNAKNKKTF